MSSISPSDNGANQTQPPIKLEDAPLHGGDIIMMRLPLDLTSHDGTPSQAFGSYLETPAIPFQRSLTSWLVLARLVQTGLYILSSIMGLLLEKHVAVRMATLQDSTTSNEPLSPPRIQQWNTAVHPVISNSPRSARAIAIGIGDEESVAKC